MKKEYMQPSIEAYNILNGTILAGSDFSVSGESNDYTQDDFGAKAGSTDGFDDLREQLDTYLK